MGLKTVPKSTQQGTGMTLVNLNCQYWQPFSVKIRIVGKYQPKEGVTYALGAELSAGKALKERGNSWLTIVKH